MSTLGNKVAQSLFHIDYSSQSSEKAEPLIVFVGRGERSREAARIIDFETLRIAAGRQGQNRKGYPLRLVILLNIALKVQPLFMHHRDPSFCRDSLAS